MSKKLAMIVGTDFEEIEMVATVDVLRRGGIETDIVSFFDEKTLKGAHGIDVKADKNFSDLRIDDYDGFIIPGGKGADHGPKALLNQDELIKFFRDVASEGKMIGAICAAPQVIAKAGILKNKWITHYPGCTQFIDTVNDQTPKATMVDENIITGVGPGASIDFALEIISYLVNPDKAQEVADGMIYRK